MVEYEARYYVLTKGELNKSNARAGALKRHPETHPSHLHQNINLERRVPSYTQPLKGEDLELTPEVVEEHRKNNVFAIDVTGDDNLVSRFLLIPAENFTICDSMYASGIISEHVSFFMHTPDNRYTFRTLEDIGQV